MSAVGSLGGTLMAWSARFSAHCNVDQLVWCQSANIAATSGAIPRGCTRPAAFEVLPPDAAFRSRTIRGVPRLWRGRSAPQRVTNVNVDDRRRELSQLGPEVPCHDGKFRPSTWAWRAHPPARRARQGPLACPLVPWQDVPPR